MNSWSILGIAPTDDISLIRKAYAQLLKVYHPEDDPAGYQRLREAYDEAMRQAKRRQRIARDEEELQNSGAKEESGDSEELDATGRSEDVEELEDPEDSDEIEGSNNIDDSEVYEDDEDLEDYEEYDEYDEYEEYEDLEDLDAEDLAMDFTFHRISQLPEQELMQTAQEKSVSEMVEEFMDQMDSTYKDLSSRLNVDLWVELLNSDIIWRVQHQYLLSDRLLDYLDEHYFLPREVWDLLEATFHWKERILRDGEEEFLEQYPKVYTYVLNKSLESRLGYTAILESGMTSYEDFFYYREAFVLAWISQEIPEANQALEEAAAIYADDPDLLRLQIEFHYRNSEFEQGLAACDGYLRLIPGDTDVYLTRARLWIGMERFPEALEQLKQIQEATPDQVEALSLSGQCYMQLGQMNSAKDAYNRILELNKEDAEAIIGLAKIHEYFERRLVSMGARERRETKRELRRALTKARPSVRNRMKVAVISLLAHKWITLIFLLLLHILIASSWQKHMAMPVGFYLKQQLYPEAPTIATWSELESLPPHVNAVRVQLTKAAYASILEFERENADGGEVVTYLFNGEAKELGEEGRISGYICFGYLGDTAIILHTNYVQTKEIFDNFSIEVEGVIQKLPQEDFMTLFRQRDKDVNYLAGNPLSEYYLITKDGISGSDLLPAIPKRIFVYVAFLGMFYISLFKELRRIFRYLRYR